VIAGQLGHIDIMVAFPGGWIRSSSCSWAGSPSCTWTGSSSEALAGSSSKGCDCSAVSSRIPRPYEGHAPECCLIMFFLCLLCCCGFYVRKRIPRKTEELTNPRRPEPSRRRHVGAATAMSLVSVAMRSRCVRSGVSVAGKHGTEGRRRARAGVRVFARAQGLLPSGSCGRSSSLNVRPRPVSASFGRVTW
jgi:hypothetical protein